MLVGEPGVGKTAVIEGLARLIELEPERVPARLRNSHIVQLQMGGLVAGTMLRGMFEERIKGIIDEVKERDNLILFIDEAHTIIGAGAAWELRLMPPTCSSRRWLAATCASSVRRRCRNTRSTSRKTKRSQDGSVW